MAIAELQKAVVDNLEGSARRRGKEELPSCSFSRLMSVLSCQHSEGQQGEETKEALKRPTWAKGRMG